MLQLALSIMLGLPFGQIVVDLQGGVVDLSGATVTFTDLGTAGDAQTPLATIYAIWTRSEMTEEQDSAATPDPFDNASQPAQAGNEYMPYADRLDTFQ